MRRASTLAAVTAVTSMAAVALLQAPAGASPTNPLPTRTNSLIQRWSATHMADVKTMDAATAQAIATRFDVVVTGGKTFAQYATAMHSANPNLKLLIYVNGAFAGKTEGTKYPDSLYARDLQGQKVTSTKYGNYLMDISQEAWGNDVAQECGVVRAATNSDGCYIDMLGSAPLLPNYTSAYPVNPATGQVWTAAAYMAATKTIAETIKAGNPGVPVAGNGMGSGGRYFKTDGGSSLPLAQALDAGHAEIWLRDSKTAADKYEPEKAWLNDVNMLKDIGDRGLSLMTQTKLWVTATADQIDAYHRYTVASFLLGTNGKSYMTFSTSRTMAAAIADHPYDKVDVGTPAGSTPVYAKVSGVYQRTFTNGVSMVNPTLYQVSNIPLPPGCFVDLGGVQHTGTVTLPSHRGDAFTPCPAAAS